MTYTERLAYSWWPYAGSNVVRGIRGCGPLGERGGQTGGSCTGPSIKDHRHCIQSQKLILSQKCPLHRIAIYETKCKFNLSSKMSSNLKH